MFFLLLRLAAERAGAADHLVVRREMHRLRAGECDELFLAADRLLVRAVDARRAAVVLAVDVEDPRLHVVGERERQDLLLDARGERGVADGERRFDAPQEIAWHPVTAGNIEFRSSAVLEAERASVLEEAVDDRGHADVLAEAGDAWHDAA